MYTKWRADWLADNSRDYARCPGLILELGRIVDMKVCAGVMNATCSLAHC
jgi:hypothetical protein